MPDEVSKKILKVLDKKLQMLAEHAEFHVNINSVVGGGIHNPHDALVVGRRAVQLGFTSTIGIIHDGDGQLRPLGDEERDVFHRDEEASTKKHYSRFNWFQDNIANGKPNDWRCRAGARYLYICEDGLVHYCSQQRGYPGIPLAEYTVADIRREFLPKRAALRTAPCRACTRCRTWTTGARRRRFATPQPPVNAGRTGADRVSAIAGRERHALLLQVSQFEIVCLSKSGLART